MIYIIKFKHIITNNSNIMAASYSHFQTRIIILAVLVFCINCSFQPLELDEPITLTIQLGSYLLAYPISRTAQRNVLFCFAPRSVVTSDASSNIQSTVGEVKKCNFQKQSSSYFCVYLYSSNNVFNVQTLNIEIDQNNIWTADTNIQRWWDSVASTKASLNQTKQQNRTNASSHSNSAQSTIFTSNPVGVGIPSASVQSYAFVQNIAITNYFANNSFYHMLTCPEYSNQTGSCQQLWKQNYVHTFKHPQKKINLIVQRRHHCGIFKQFDQQITNHVFYGGVLRQGNYHMFFAILNHLSNDSQVLNMWGGISYSYDHANRDMFCYATDGSNFDATSLIAGALYKDIAPNIDGKQNVQIVDSFYSERYEKNYMYFIQYHRPYDTGDRLGDEKLFRKIYDQFAFAARFDYTDITNNTIINTPSCLKQQHYHNFLMSFIADVSVYERRLRWAIMFVMIYVIFNI